MHEEDREVLKESVRDAIGNSGRGKTSRKMFKKRVAKVIRRTSAASYILTNKMIESALSLVEELWAEVVAEEDSAS
jgi:hypothetical protein